MRVERRSPRASAECHAEGQVEALLVHGNEHGVVIRPDGSFARLAPVGDGLFVVVDEEVGE